MNFVTAARFKVKQPKWVIANLVETTQTATENIMKGYDRSKKPKGELEKKLTTDLSPSSRKEHSYSNVNVPSKAEKLQRDVFGATILPSNLSFDNMKKLSMNQIKLEEIPLVDENQVAEVLVAEKMSKGEMKEPEETKVSENSKSDTGKQTESDSLLVPAKKSDRTIHRYLDFSKADPYEEIPGPRIFQNLAVTLRFMARQTTLFFFLNMLRSDSLGPLRKYGPIVRLPDIFGGKLLLVNRSEHISAIYEQDKLHPSSSTLDVLEHSRIRRHGKSESSSLSPTEWEEVKKAVNDLLLKDGERYFESLEENGNYLVKRIRAQKNRENEVMDDFIDEVNKWSIECLLQILFDKSFGFLDADSAEEATKNEQLYQALSNATREYGRCESGFQLWRVMSTKSSVNLDGACQKAEEILYDFIYQLQMNLSNKSKDLKSEPPTYVGSLLINGVSRSDVLTHVLDTLIIGMNAMTSGLIFLLYHLAKNPRAQQELYGEIKKILPEKYSRLENDHLQSMKYLQACLKESLRLKMPMPIMTKMLNRDVIISNFQIPRSTYVVMAAQVEALKDENFEAGREFRPKRWLEPENNHPFTALPMGLHGQNHFEQRMAEVALKACVAQIIRNFSVEYPHETLRATNSSISCPKQPLKFSFFERED